jgi:hypothetical protein
MAETPKQKFNPKSASFRLFEVASGSKGLYVPKGTKYNTTFFVESAVPDLVEYACQENR